MIALINGKETITIIEKTVEITQLGGSNLFYLQQYE